MKSRYGFVSNSSSSSFIVGIKHKNEEDRLCHILKSGPTPKFPAEYATKIAKEAGHGKKAAALIVQKAQSLVEYWGDKKKC